MAQEMNVGQELLNVPMGEMIQSMASAIADAQWELDKGAMVVAEMMSGQRLLRDMETGALLDYDGTPLLPKKSGGGDEEFELDLAGDPVYEPDDGPRVLDTRVYFGYVYEPQLDDQGKVVTVDLGGDAPVPQMIRKPNRVSMMELGFTPTFYQFVDTVIEVKMAIKMVSMTSSKTRTSSKSQSKIGVQVGYGGSGRGWGYGVRAQYSQAYSSSVDATYANKFGYSVEGSSLLRTKLVPVPVPTMLDERIREVMETERIYFDQVAGREVAEVQEPAPPPAASTEAAEEAPA